MKGITETTNLLNQENEDQLVCTKRMAKLLGVSTQWLEIGRVHGYGPPFIKLTPRMVRYRIGDVKKWLADRVYHSTSEYNSNSGEK